ncbi:MAG: hypothetical protein IH840_13850 [Candidatus Heimdallarchaeota archaeon]|nr:hypothetical protein [Candidatus Heimdallarchaeota archaeon]
MALNYSLLSQDTRRVITSISWFILMIPLAMASHFFAKLYYIMGFTIIGWSFATLGAIQLGTVITNKRLWNITGKTINQPAVA